MEAHPAYDSRLAVSDADGEVVHYWVRRDFDLMKRIEQVYGPLAELEQKLRKCALTGEQLVALYDIMLKAQESRPPVSEVQEHVSYVGVLECCNELAVVVLNMFAGHRAAVAWLAGERQRLAAGESVPFDQALSTGINTLRQRGSSDGRPASSGGPHTTN